MNVTTSFGKNKKVIASFGPLISYGLGGSVTGTETTSGIWGPVYTIPINYAVKFDGSTKNDGNTHYKAFEVGGNVMLGYKFSPKYSLSMIYNTTFTNSAPNREGFTNTYKPSYWGLNFGYSFF